MMTRLSFVTVVCLSFAAHALAQSKPKADFDAIVVGSGYGGSVAALRLGEAQAHTLVLERGKWWTVQDPNTNSTFATLPSVVSSGDPRSTWLNDVCTGNLYTSAAFGSPPIPCQKYTGILEILDDVPNLYDASPAVQLNGVRAMVAAGVGGGSLVNNGITYQPTKAGWDIAYPAAQLPEMQKVWKELDKVYFKRALQNLAPQAVPADVLATPAYQGSVTLDAMFAAAGYPKEDPKNAATLTFGRTYTPTIVDWNKVREEGVSRVPSATVGEDWYGMNSDAKKSLDKPEGYLGRALATGNVEVRALHTVTDIAYDEHSKLYTVTALHTDEAYNELETLTFRTRHLILAAGSIGTTKILVRARDSGALPKLSSAVGTRFSNNGAQAHLRFISATPIGQGGPATLKVTDFGQAGNPVVIENLPARVPSWFAGVPSLQKFFGAVMTIAIGIPSATGNFHYDAPSDTVVLDWPATGAQNVYDRAVQVLTNPALPGTPLIFPAASALATTLHPLGGVPLGVATDKHCQVGGYKKLYVVDGSLIPGSSAAANPSLLITALAERCMDSIADEVSDDCDGHDDDDD